MDSTPSVSSRSSAIADSGSRTPTPPPHPVPSKKPAPPCPPTLAPVLPQHYQTPTETTPLPPPPPMDQTTEPPTIRIADAVPLPELQPLLIEKLLLTIERLNVVIEQQAQLLQHFYRQSLLPPPIIPPIIAPPPQAAPPPPTTTTSTSTTSGLMNDRCSFSEVSSESCRSSSSASPLSAQPWAREQFPDHPLWESDAVSEVSDIVRRCLSPSPRCVPSTQCGRPRCKQPPPLATRAVLPPPLRPPPPPPQPPLATQPPNEPPKSDAEPKTDPPTEPPKNDAEPKTDPPTEPPKSDAEPKTDAPMPGRLPEPRRPRQVQASSSSSAPIYLLPLRLWEC